MERKRLARASQNKDNNRPSGNPTQGSLSQWTAAAATSPALIENMQI
jgi:hypothetical protein